MPLLKVDMPRGGKRDGSGAPSKGHRVRRAMVNLDAIHNTILIELEDEMRMSTSDILRWAIRVAHASRVKKR